MLSNCTIDEAKLVCERIRQFVASEKIATPAGMLDASVSIGLTACRPDNEGLERLVGAADADLYRVKDKGRNRVEVAD